MTQNSLNPRKQEFELLEFTLSAVSMIMTYAGKSRIPQPGRLRQGTPEPVERVNTIPESKVIPTLKIAPRVRAEKGSETADGKKTMIGRQAFPKGKTVTEKSHSRVTGKELEDEKWPLYAYQDATGRPYEHRLMMGQVQRLLARDTHARVLQTGEQLLATYDHTVGTNGEAALAESTAINWSKVATVHLLDSTGTLNQHLDIGPATAFNPFHDDEKSFILEAGKALKSHNSEITLKFGVAIKSWAQIARNFNLSFEGQILANESRPRPWRSRQVLKDEYQRLKGKTPQAKNENFTGRFSSSSKQDVSDVHHSRIRMGSSPNESGYRSLALASRLPVWKSNGDSRSRQKVVSD